MSTTTTWNANWCNTWRSVFNSWRDNNLAYQGQWSSYGLNRGLWGFNDSSIRTTLAGRRILSVRLTVTRNSSAHGSYGAGYPTFRQHNYSTQPSGRPTMGTSFSSPVGFALGDRKTVTLPTSWGAALRDGTARGLGVYTTSNTPYLQFLSNATLSITHEAINNPPYSPALKSPSSGATLSAEVTNRFSWEFQDPDSGDYQSQYQFQIHDGTATVHDRTVNTSTEAYDLPNDTLGAGSYSWRVRTRDQHGAQGPYSSYRGFTLTVTPDAPIPPTITSPDDWETLNVNQHLVEWSHTISLKASEARRMEDDEGLPGFTAYETVAVGPTVRSWLFEFPVNHRWEHLQVRVQDAATDLWSDWASVMVYLDFSPPPVPAVVNTVGDPALAAIHVTWEAPAPATDEPDIASVTVRRRRVGLDEGEGIVVALNRDPLEPTITDFTPGTNVEYEYRVIARGTNGVTSTSEWTL